MTTFVALALFGLTGALVSLTAVLAHTVRRLGRTEEAVVRLADRQIVELTRRRLLVRQLRKVEARTGTAAHRRIDLEAGRLN